MSLRIPASLLFLFLPLSLAASACSTSTDADEAAPDEAASDENADEVAKKKSKEKKPTLSCAAVFGECVGLSPSSCVGGTWADATVVTCGGGIGVGCCVKPTPPPPPPPPPPPSECPELTPPSPGFCPDGETKPRYDQGCLVGFECVQSTCVSKGGQCVGLNPAACPSGRWGEASTHPCGTGIGVGCCLP